MVQFGTIYRCFLLQGLCPRKSAWNLKITDLEGKIIFQTFVFGLHVNLLGCMLVFMGCTGRQREREREYLVVENKHKFVSKQKGISRFFQVLGFVLDLQILSEACQTRELGGCQLDYVGNAGSICCLDVPRS